MTVRLASLSSLADVYSGGAAPQDEGAFSSSGSPFIRAGSLRKLLDGAREESLEKLSPEIAEGYGLRLFPANTVLFAKSGMSATKGYVYRLRDPAYVVSHLAAVVPKDQHDAAFIQRALEHYSPVTLIKDPAYPSIRLGEIEEHKIGIPTKKSERLRIADILDHADSLRRKRRVALGKLGALSRSVFNEMFGDPVQNPRNLPRMSIGAALQEGLLEDVQDGNHGEKHPKVEDFSERGIPFVMANCLHDGELNLSEAYRLPSHWLQALRVGFAKPKDVLLSHKGTVGETAVVTNSEPLLILSPQVTYYRCGQGLVPEFLQGCFQSSTFQTILKKEAIQSTRAYIGLNRQKTLQILLPDHSLQEGYATKVADIHSAVHRLRQHSEALSCLYRSLQLNLFNGAL